MSTLAEKLKEFFKNKKVASISEVLDEFNEENRNTIEKHLRKFNRQYVSNKNGNRRVFFTEDAAKEWHSVDVSRQRDFCSIVNSKVYYEVCKDYCDKFYSCKEKFYILFPELKETEETSEQADRMQRWYKKRKQLNKFP